MPLASTGLIPNWCACPTYPHLTFLDTKVKPKKGRFALIVFESKTDTLCKEKK
jgi:hypothetical protein